MDRIYSIAIDGPSGSGKSTVAKTLSKELGITYIDTGAMYRAVGLYCINNNIDTSYKDKVINALNNISITFKNEDYIRKIYLNNVDVTETIRTQEVGMEASNVAAIFEVRERLVNIQRELSKTESVIMDGRDIGTNVLKYADLKIYLDASVIERTKRRIGELNLKGISADFETVKGEIEKRDYNDINREFNPLYKAEDAYEIISDGMSIKEVCEKIKELAKAKKLI